MTSELHWFKWDSAEILKILTIVFEALSDKKLPATLCNWWTLDSGPLRYVLTYLVAVLVFIWSPWVPLAGIDRGGEMTALLGHAHLWVPAVGSAAEHCEKCVARSQGQAWSQLKNLLGSVSVLVRSKVLFCREKKFSVLFCIKIDSIMMKQEPYWLFWTLRQSVECSCKRRVIYHYFPFLATILDSLSLKISCFWMSSGTKESRRPLFPVSLESS